MNVSNRLVKAQLFGVDRSTAIEKGLSLPSGRLAGEIQSRLLVLSDFLLDLLPLRAEVVEVLELGFKGGQALLSVSVELGQLYLLVSCEVAVIEVVVESLDLFIP